MQPYGASIASRQGDIRPVHNRNHGSRIGSYLVDGRTKGLAKIGLYKIPRYTTGSVGIDRHRSPGDPLEKSAENKPLRRVDVYLDGTGRRLLGLQTKGRQQQQEQYPAGWLMDVHR